MRHHWRKLWKCDRTQRSLSCFTPLERNVSCLARRRKKKYIEAEFHQSKLWRNYDWLFSCIWALQRKRTHVGIESVDRSSGLLHCKPPSRSRSDCRSLPGSDTWRCCLMRTSLDSGKRHDRPEALWAAGCSNFDWHTPGWPLSSARWLCTHAGAILWGRSLRCNGTQRYHPVDWREWYSYDRWWCPRVLRTEHLWKEHREWEGERDAS